MSEEGHVKEANSVPEGITEVPVTQAVSDASKDADNHSPNTDHIVPPVKEPIDPTDPEDGLEVVKKTLAELAGSVAMLANTVADLTKDESPHHSKPWTHYGDKDDDE